MRCLYFIRPSDEEAECSRCGCVTPPYSAFYGCEMHDYYICDDCSSAQMKYFIVIYTLQQKFHNERIIRTILEEEEEDARH